MRRSGAAASPRPASGGSDAGSSGGTISDPESDDSVSRAVRAHEAMLQARRRAADAETARRDARVARRERNAGVARAHAPHDAAEQACVVLELDLAPAALSTATPQALAAVHDAVVAAVVTEARSMASLLASHHGGTVLAIRLLADESRRTAERYVRGVRRGNGGGPSMARLVLPAVRTFAPGVSGTASVRRAAVWTVDAAGAPQLPTYTQCVAALQQAAESPLEPDVPWA